jgi:hypothetical protein
MRFILCFLLALPCFAALTVEQKTLAHNAATFLAVGKQGTLSYTLREDSASGTVLPTSVTEVTRANDDVLFTLGNAPYFLQQDQKHYLSVTDGTTTVNLTFDTPTVPFGYAGPPLVPYNASRWNGVNFYPFNFTQNYKKAIDPTGLAYLNMLKPGAHGWKAGPFAFEFNTCGAGWANCSNAANGGLASVATTTGTDPMYLYTDAGSDPSKGGDRWKNPMAYQANVDDVGLVVWGSASSTTGDDEVIDVCIAFHKTCVGNTVAISLPTGSVAHVQSANADSNKPWPDTFGTHYDLSWGEAARITRDRWNVRSLGNATVTAGAISFASFYEDNYLPPMAPGDDIRIGSAVKTIATYTHANSATITDGAFSATDIIFAPGWGIKVVPRTAASKTFGAKWMGVGTKVSSSFAEGSKVSFVQFTSGDGVVGSLATIPTLSASYYLRFFIPADGKTAPRALGAWNIPHTAINASHSAGDRANGAYAYANPSIGFDSANGKIAYVGNTPTDTSVRTLWKLEYTGNATTEIDYLYAGGGAEGEGSESTTWTNMFKASDGALLHDSIVTYLAGKGITWNSTLYGSWNSATYYGTSNGHTVYGRLPHGGDNGTCWVAVIRNSDKAIRMVAHTLDGMPDAPSMRGATCHSFSANTAPDIINFSYNYLGKNPSATYVHSGPFEVQFTHKWVSGAWNADTSLPNLGTATYDRTCDADVSAQVTSFGRNPSTDCVSFKGPVYASSNAPAAELAAFGCSFDATKSCAKAPAVGDKLQHHVGGAVTHPENYTILKLTDLGGGEWRYHLLRDAATDYCCHIARGGTCISGDGLNWQRPDNWTAALIGGEYMQAGCASPQMIGYFAPSTPEYATAVGPLGGHSTMTPHANNKVSWISPAFTKYNYTFSELDDSPSAGTSLAAPTFGSVALPLGSLNQVYNSATHVLASSDERVMAFDWNFIGGAGADHMGNSINIHIGSTGLTGCSGDVCNLTPIGPGNYRAHGYDGWVGHRRLRDFSGPNKVLADMPDESFVVNYRAGLGYGTGDTTLGKVWVKASKRYVGTYDDLCPPGMIFQRIPCITTGLGKGMIRRFRFDRADPTGVNKQALGFAHQMPGGHVSYAGVTPIPSGRYLIASGAGALEGLQSAALLYSVPQPRLDSTVRNTFDGMAASVGPVTGATTARFVWGYNTSLQCSGASEQCVTDSVITPYAYIGETGLTPHTIGTGVTITIPVQRGVLFYYKTQWLDGSGNVVAESEIESGLA